MKILVILMGLFIYQSGHAQPVVSGGVFTQVTPSGPIEMMNVVIPGQTTRNYSAYFVVNVRNSCFGTLGRSVPRVPFVPNANIQFNFTLSRPSGNTSVQVIYPGALAATSAGTVGMAGYRVIPNADKIPATMRAATYGNVLRLEIPISNTPTIDSNGLVIPEQAPQIRNYTFQQIVPPSTSNYSYPCIGTTGVASICSSPPRSGVLSSKVNIMQPAGSYSSEVQVSFPGQSEYCSGHF